jgi:hypothetical protein
VVPAIEVTSDPEHPQVHWVVDHPENNLVVLIHLPLERVEIVLAINYFVRCASFFKATRMNPGALYSGCFRSIQNLKFPDLIES